MNEYGLYRRALWYDVYCRATVYKLSESGITSLVFQLEEARTAKDFSLADQLSIVPWSAS